MPKYLYECDNCKERFTVFHMMGESIDICEKCDHKGEIKRLPLFPIRLNKTKKEKKVGQVVKSHIEEIKEDLKKEKEDLKREYKP